MHGSVGACLNRKDYTMIIDTEESTGAWFDLPGGGRIQMRTLSGNDWMEIRKATVRMGPPEYPNLDGKYQRFQPEITDTDLQLELRWDMTIVAWEGILDKAGKPIPCTREWKTKLMLLDNPIFRDFVLEKIKVMQTADDELKSVAEKN